MTILRSPHPSHPERTCRVSGYERRLPAKPIKPVKFYTICDQLYDAHLGDVLANTLARMDVSDCREGR